jgi:hypothetical protein
MQKGPNPNWGSPSFLLNGHSNPFPGVKQPVRILTTHFHQVPRLRMSGAIPLKPLRLYGVVRESFTILLLKVLTTAESDLKLRTDLV